VRISSKADYAVRAMLELAGAEKEELVKGEVVSSAQRIPLPFLENILSELRNHGLVTSKRGAEGGYRLSRPAEKITIADVIRAVEGPLATVRGEDPEEVSYDGAASGLSDVWIALRANVRGVLEEVTLADVLAGELPARARPDATSPRTPGQSSR
jgi:Rrf2 family protein